MNINKALSTYLRSTFRFDVQEEVICVPKSSIKIHSERYDKVYSEKYINEGIIYHRLFKNDVVVYVSIAK